MNSCFKCPVCQGDKWQKVEEYHFVRDDAEIDWRWKDRKDRLGLVFRLLTILMMKRPARFPLSQQIHTPWHKLRRQIYFDVWHAPETLRSINCGICGFICYTPRPTEEEIEAKYMFLEKYEPYTIGQNDAETVRMDLQRSEQLYRAVTPYLTGKRVLDFGGASGIILSAFKERGYQCHLADYSNRQLPGIKKVANSLKDLKGTYDCILLCNVLEHVAEPRKLLEGLKKHLNDNGLLYVEVPVEIWGGVHRIIIDPVTHVNFFTEGSLLTILQMSGFKLAKDFRGPIIFGRPMTEYLHAVALKGHDKLTFKPGITNAMLYPERIYSTKRLWRMGQKKAKESSLKNSQGKRL